MIVKIINKSNNPLPEYKIDGDAGMDLRTNLSESITLHPNERRLIPTGIYIQLPYGYEAQIRPRSGLSLKTGLNVILGTIDSIFRGEIGIIVHNISDNNITINNSDRIAQMIINKVEKADWIEVSELDSTDRGSNGFGHTGVN